MSALTYRAVLARIAESAPVEGYQRVIDLPELSHEDIAAIVRHYPGIFMDALAEYDTELRALVPESLEQAGCPMDRYRLIGVHLVAALRRYVLPLVLRDVQMACERRRDLDALEGPSDRDILTIDQFTACELGLGRLS